MAEEQDESPIIIEHPTAEVNNISEVQGDRHCLNCSALLTGPYCAECGQKDIPSRQTLHELVTNFISSFFGYESKVFVTIKYLLTRPGFLVNEYNKGRRERYFHPARLYVFISVVYFFLFTSLPETENNNHVNVNTDSTTVNYFKSQRGKVVTREQYDSVQATLPAAERDGWFKQKWKYKRLDLETRFYDNPSGFARSVIDEFLAHFSTVFFFLLPVFAGILMLLYKNHNFYFSEHLVFSIYYYNFFFVAGIVSLLLEQVSWLWWVGLMVDISIPVYLYLALRRTYRESRGKTLAKFLAFLFIFGFCIGIGLLINLVVALLMV